MLTNFAAGTLIVLGALFAFLGVFAGGGNVTFTLIGLGSVAVGGILGLLGRRPSA
jgi:hypothetical protein